MHFSKIWDFLRTSTHKKQRSRRGVRLAVEVLEDRSVPTATASGIVTGLIYVDANGNGIHDQGEPILPGVAVTLSGHTSQNVVVNATATTDVHGSFQFNNVLPGAYSLKAGPVSGLYNGTTQVGIVNAPSGVTIALPTPLNASENIGVKGSLSLTNTGIGVGLFLTTTTEANFPLKSSAPGSGQAIANFRPNNAPTISNAFTNITAAQGGSSMIDLAGHFTDPDYTHTEVAFNVTANGTHYTINVNLNDATAPQAVANFLDYVKSGAYANSIFSRLVTSGISILQGGGVTLNSSAATGLSLIPTLPPVVNEEAVPFTGNITSGSAIVTGIGSTANLRAGMAVNSASGIAGIPTGATILNILGATSITLSTAATASTTGFALAAVIPTSQPNAAFTLAAARTSDFNSGTDQFFFNTADNSAALPDYTVFGTVADAASQQALRTLAATQASGTINNQSSSAAAAANPGVAFNNVPLVNYTGTNFASDATAANFLVVNSVTVVKQDEVLTYTAHVTNAAGNTGSNPLVTATIANERLNLAYAPGETGSATVTVTATDRYGATVTSQAFTVTVTGAPAITSAPVTLNGSVLTASPVATQVNNSPVTFTYQWLQGGIPIPGATSATLSLSQSPLGHVHVGDAFSVQITPTDGNNITGAVFTTSPVTITATNPFAINAPVITSVPVTLSGTVLTAAPVATDPHNSPVTFTYQWLQGGVAIPGATSATLDLSQAPLGNVQVGNTFSVQVTPTDGSNITGAVFTSPSVTVTAINPITIAGSAPVITSARVSLSGTVLTAAPVATDAGNSPVTFTYQWLQGAVAISGATSATLDLSHAPLGNVQVGNSFTVQITPTDGNNLTGAVFTTNAVTVTGINPITINAPAISSVPVTLSGNVLTAAPVATDPNNSPITFTYQWLQGGVAISGATSATLDLSQAPLGNVQVGNSFSVTVTAANGHNIAGPAFTSTSLIVTAINPIAVTFSPPVITAAPVTLHGAVLTAAPVATDPNNGQVTFTYQWLQGGVAISGATSATLNLSQAPLGNVQIGNAFSVQITPTDSNNVTGAVFTTTPVTVTATSPLTVAVNPPVVTSAPVTLSGSVLTVAPVGTDPNSSPITFTYQWLQGGVAISGATSATLDLSQSPLGNVQPGNTFSVVVTPTNANNVVGAVFTTTPVTVTAINPIAVAVNPPVVTTAPVTLSGSVLTVAPTATDPANSPVIFTYQWLQGGVAISGATSATLDFTQAPLGNVQIGDSFSVVVTPIDGNNITGAVFSSTPVTVTGTNPFTIT